LWGDRHKTHHHPHSPHLTLNAVVEILKRAQQEELPCLLVGGHAVILYRIPRFTRDIDFVIPDEAVERWLDFLQRLQYRVYHRTGAFIQLEPATPGSLPPVDLMLVDQDTWSKLQAKAESRDAGEGLLLPVPHPWHLIAMKLTAAKSAARRVGASDWSDIFDLLRTCQIDLNDPEFRRLVVRFGGDEALNRMEREGQ
jgi:Nucleotidyl transferase AbiEii toxin, Type IV TA system